MNKIKKTTVDGDFPGGNIIAVREESGGFVLRPDLRDTVGQWFYWCFRVSNAAGQRLRFSIESPGVVGIHGPGISTDQGITWRWLGAETTEGQSFVYDFASGQNDVRFSFTMPYQQSSLELFLEGRDSIRMEELCRSASGRRVELLRFGNLDRNPSCRVMLTCRHHACEMMANYVLEGIMDEATSQSDTGRRLSEHVAFAAIPFVDKDGVESGDQGKNRSPHDHGRDYAANGSLYPETAALRQWAESWLDGRPACAIDLHCPGSRGRFHEMVLFPTRARSQVNWEAMRPFLRLLETEQSGVLPFSLSENEEFETWDGKPYSPHPELRGFSAWAQQLDGVLFASSLEIPYANAGGKEVNQHTARAFGRDLARAMQLYMAEAAGTQD